MAPPSTTVVAIGVTALSALLILRRRELYRWWLSTWRGDDPESASTASLRIVKAEIIAVERDVKRAEADADALELELVKQQELYQAPAPATPTRAAPVTPPAAIVTPAASDTAMRAPVDPALASSPDRPVTPAARLQGAHYAHRDTGRDLVVCEPPARIDGAPPAAGAAREGGAAAASGYYFYSSDGRKFENKWDSYDADAELARLDEADGGDARDAATRARRELARRAGTLRTRAAELEQRVFEALDVLDHEVRGGDAVRAPRRALVARAQALFPRVDRVAEAVRKYERAEAARRERPAHE